MKIRKFNENIDIPYYKELGYDTNMMDYLSKLYQLWTDAEGLPELSADDLIMLDREDTETLTSEQLEYLQAFMSFWELTQNFESKYSRRDFVPGKIIKNYNI